MSPAVTLRIPAALNPLIANNTTHERLRKRAGKAWISYKKSITDWHQVYSYQIYYLLERIYLICDADYDVNLIIEGTQVRAEIDDLTFISTYHEQYENLPSAQVSQVFGVRLWWQCRSCHHVITSEEIITTSELGQILEKFTPDHTHRCRRRKRS